MNAPVDPGTRTSARRFRRSPYRTLVVVIVLVILAIVRYVREDDAVPTPAEPLAEGMHGVVRVVDGDTIIVGSDSVVRLIGVDTPETVKPDHPVEPFGPEATKFTRQFLAGGTARLEFDRERVDRFGRFLAYVWVGDRMLNEELLRAGLARWEPNFHYSAAKKAIFREAQEQARDEGLGLWSDDAKKGQEKASLDGDPATRHARVEAAGLCEFAILTA
ncbi:MAG: thermonuclease [Planctomycetota bacterium]|nr:MAG: thermonuclease [Planctomycetota bacterium]